MCSKCFFYFIYLFICVSRESWEKESAVSVWEKFSGADLRCKMQKSLQYVFKCWFPQCRLLLHSDPWCYPTCVINCINYLKLSTTTSWPWLQCLSQELYKRHGRKMWVGIMAEKMRLWLAQWTTVFSLWMSGYILQCPSHDTFTFTGRLHHSSTIPAQDPVKCFILGF